MNMKLIRSRGFTLMETLVSIGVCVLVFGAIGFLVFVGSRSAINIHIQSLSQNDCAMASERITAFLRNAVGYRMIPDDTMGDPVQRIYAEFPNTPTDVTTYTVCLKTYEPSAIDQYYYPSRGNRKEVQIYKGTVSSWKTSEYNNPDTTLEPIAKYSVEDFSILYQTEYRLVITSSFAYKGFALVFDTPGITQHGDYITEAIAKNHFMSQGVDNYALDPSGLPYAL